VGRGVGRGWMLAGERGGFPPPSRKYRQYAIILAIIIKKNRGFT
jgi:hypothetical protein